jgi:hypothetical protein
MSRKWERMVRKNAKQANKLRARQGKDRIVSGSGDSVMVIKGRSWFLPAFLIAVSLFFMISFRNVYQQDTVYWLTVALYFLMGIFIFFVRRPYLKIGRNSLATRRFSGEKTISAEEVADIGFLPGSIVIQLKGKREKWVFSRIFQRFNMTLMEQELRNFAKRHHVPVTGEAIGKSTKKEEEV